MSRSAPPAAGSRYLVVRGPRTALRLALPAFGNLTLGRDPACQVRVDEEGLADHAAEIFLDFDVGLQVNAPGAQRLPFDPAGESAPVPVSPGKTVDLAPGDRVRVGPIEIGFAPAIHEPRTHHVWSRAYLETRLQELLWQGGGQVSLLRVRVEGLDRPLTEQILGAAIGAGDLLGEMGLGEHAILVVGPEARGRTVAREVTRALQDRDAEVRLGLAPARDHTEPATLLEQAALRLDSVAGGADSSVCMPSDPAMEPVMRLIDQVSRTSAPVLILGETGTGKDVLAQMIHERSDRAPGPLVRVNCIDLPETFLEDPQTNFLTRAAGGTVVLDQVGGLTPRAQVSLGYLLEESSVQEHDVRFIATSNQDLASAAETGSFRKDLYFRLNRVTLAVPPLRERRRDIGALAQHFVDEAVRDRGRTPRPQLTRAAAAQLEAYDWPGNLRELRNVVEHAVLTASGDTLSVEQLPAEITGQVPTPSGATAPISSGARKPANLRDEIAALEKRRILEALEAYPTQTEAAKALGIPLRTFLNRLDALGIPRARKSASD